MLRKLDTLYELKTDSTELGISYRIINKTKYLDVNV